MTPDLIRVSVGIEHIEDIKEDFQQAFDARREGGRVTLGRRADRTRATCELPGPFDLESGEPAAVR